MDGMRNMAEHTVRRKFWSRGMNSAAMKYYEELIHGTVADLVDGLEQRMSQKVDISLWMTFFGYYISILMLIMVAYGIIVRFDFMGRMAWVLVLVPDL